jgi:hypothetical protein
MKSCPTCNRTYTDEMLSYCLDDGTPLQQAIVGGPPSGSTPSFDPQATVSFQPGRDTSPPSQPSATAPTIMSNQSMGVPPQPAVHPPVAQPQQWRPAPQMQSPPKKRSALPWIIVGLIVLLLLVGGGIGLVGLLVYVGSQAANTNTSSGNSNLTVRKPNVVGNKNAGVSEPPPPPSSSPEEEVSDLDDDFSENKWGTGSDELGKFWYANEELHAQAVPGRYVVEYSPKETPYYTKNATVKITVRSVDGESPKYGYGIVVHGQMKEKKLEDYAFIIKTDADPSYSIVLQKDGKEDVLTKWTSSTAIRKGTSPNQLQIRIKDDKLDFYINDRYVNGITDTANFKTGRVGIYTSDTAEVAFDDLTIVHQAF